MSGQDRRWNHNTQYYRLILAAVPPGCQRVLDVGCGEGMLARQLHHMDPAAALAAMSQLLVPGGALVIVGLARSQPRDFPRDAAAVIANLGYRMAKGCWEQPSPTVWPPPHSYRQIRALAGATLPGVRYRRHLLWRYSPVWVKPAS